MEALKLDLAVSHSCRLPDLAFYVFGGWRRYPVSSQLALYWAIMVTVYPYQDRSLPQWPYNLSINSLVSIYGVVLKAAILLVLAEGLGLLFSTASSCVI